MGNTQSARLNSYLTQVSSNPFVWGFRDCCTFAADWCIENGHSDPMARWRGEYDDELSATDQMLQGDGLWAMWELGMIDAQIPECDEPRMGDVGLIAVVGTQGFEAVGAIYGGKRWHALSPNGLFCASIAPEHVLKTWRV